MRKRQVEVYFFFKGNCEFSLLWFLLLHVTNFYKPFVEKHHRGFVYLNTQNKYVT